MSVGRVARSAFIVFLLLLHLADQATDVFSAVLFYLEGNCVAAGVTLALVFMPGVFIFATEMALMCEGGSNIGRAVGYLFFSPLWAVVIHLYR